jgi:hypothetical protein
LPGFISSSLIEVKVIADLFVLLFDDFVIMSHDDSRRLLVVVGLDNRLLLES